jgi:hypothetical protein
MILFIYFQLNCCYLKEKWLGKWVMCSMLICVPLCKEYSIYVRPEEKLRGLSPSFHIHVSVSDLYIPTIGPHIFLQ